jgi:DNA invertase Pin-like site-specific DNA recombinase
MTKIKENQIAVYLRVSSAAQSLEMQRSAITRLAKAREDNIDVWYPEKMSGGTMNRPVLDEVRRLARQGYIRKLYFYRLDRLTRTGIADTLNLIKEFRSYGVELISVADGFDLNGITGELVISIMSWAAENERKVINERLSSARTRLEEAGRSWGRPRKVYDIEAMLKLRQEGYNDSQVALRVNVPRSTVARLLKEVA